MISTKRVVISTDKQTTLIHLVAIPYPSEVSALVRARAKFDMPIPVCQRRIHTSHQVRLDVTCARFEDNDEIASEAIDRLMTGWTVDAFTACEPFVDPVKHRTLPDQTGQQSIEDTIAQLATIGIDIPKQE